jgi:hypothetical protein
MNERNVNALSGIVGKVLRYYGLEGPNGPRGMSWWEEEGFRDIAKSLASEGVLGPASEVLSNVQLGAVWDKGVDGSGENCCSGVHFDELKVPDMAAELERIAKGG